MMDIFPCEAQMLCRVVGSAPRPRGSAVHASIFAVGVRRCPLVRQRSLSLNDHAQNKRCGQRCVCRTRAARAAARADWVAERHPPWSAMLTPNILPLASGDGLAPGRAYECGLKPRSPPRWVQSEEWTAHGSTIEFTVRRCRQWQMGLSWARVATAWSSH